MSERDEKPMPPSTLSSGLSVIDGGQMSLGKRFPRKNEIVLQKIFFMLMHIPNSSSQGRKKAEKIGFLCESTLLRSGG